MDRERGELILGRRKRVHKDRKVYKNTEYWGWLTILMHIMQRLLGRLTGIEIGGIGRQGLDSGGPCFLRWEFWLLFLDVGHPLRMFFS